MTKKSGNVAFDCGFPALIAPASLKRVSIEELGALVGTRFPALIAPASLKHEDHPRLLPPERLFSGVNCAGLIEAGGGKDANAPLAGVFRR